MNTHLCQVKNLIECCLDLFIKSDIGTIGPDNLISCSSVELLHSNDFTKFQLHVEYDFRTISLDS